MIGAIDVHAHFWPRGLLATVSEGGNWYGWRVLSDHDGRRALSTGQRLAPSNPPTDDLAEHEARSRNRQKEQGIVLEALMPVGYLWSYHLPADLARRFTREINEELADLQRVNPKSFRGLGYLPVQDTNLALTELEYAVKDLGLRSFAIATCVNGKNVDDPAISPVLEAIADAGASLNIHPEYWDKLGEDRMPRHQLERSFGAPLEAGLAVASIIYSGIMDRRPSLRLCFSHGGGVVHGTIGRLSHRYRTSSLARPVARLPLDYLRLFYYDCLVHDEELLHFIVNRVGHDRLLVGTDYPFDGDVEGGAANWIRGMDWLNEDQKQCVLWRNATTFLGLSGEQIAREL